MPTKKRRIFFTPTDESLRCIDDIAAASGVPASVVVAEIVGACETRLQDIAWARMSIAEMTRDLQGAFGQLEEYGLDPLTLSLPDQESELQTLILAAHEKLQDVSARFAKHVTRTATTAERASMIARLAVASAQGAA